MIVREHPLVPGWWLIGARPNSTELTFERLQRTMCELAELVAADQRVGS